MSMLLAAPGLIRLPSAGGAAKSIAYISGTRDGADIPGGGSLTYANAFPSAGTYLVFLHNASGDGVASIGLSSGAVDQYLVQANNGLTNPRWSLVVAWVTATDISDLIVYSTQTSYEQHFMIYKIEGYTRANSIANYNWSNDSVTSISTSLASVPAGADVISVLVGEGSDDLATATWGGDVSPSDADNSVVDGANRIHLYSAISNAVAGGAFDATCAIDPDEWAIMAVAIS